MARCALSCGFLLLCLAVLAIYCSSATTDWLQGDVGGDVLHIGLWRSCLGSDCVSNFDNDGEIMQVLGAWMYLCQSCSIASIIISSVCVILIAVYIFQGNQFIIPWMTMLTFLAALVYGLGALVFCLEASHTKIAYNGNHPLRLGVSLYLGLTGCIIGLAAAAVMLGEAHVEHPHYQRTHQKKPHQRKHIEYTPIQ